MHLSEYVDLVLLSRKYYYHYIVVIIINSSSSSSIPTVDKNNIAKKKIRYPCPRLMYEMRVCYRSNEFLFLIIISNYTVSEMAKNKKNIKINDVVNIVVIIMVLLLVEYTIFKNKT